MGSKISSKGIFVAGKARVSGFVGDKDSKISDLVKRDLNKK